MLSKYVWLISVEKISFIRSCDMEAIKAMDCIIKVRITTGNIKWRSFALRFRASNHESAWQPMLPSAKGLSFILVLYLIQESWWSSPFLFTFYPLASTLCWKDSDIYIYPIGCKASWTIIVDITLEVKGWEVNLEAPIFLCVWLKLWTHKYRVSVSNCERLNDSWVCGLAEKLLHWLFPMLW